LQDRPSALGVVLNVVGWAAVEHVRGVWRPLMDDRQRSLILMMYAYLVAVAAGVNFYWTVDDTALAKLLHSQWLLRGSFDVIVAGSQLALVAVVVIAARVLIPMFGTAAERRRGVLARVAAPVLIGIVTLGWMLGAAAWSHQHWGSARVPTPWDVSGDWTAPAGWPPLGTRMVLGAVSLVVLAAALALSGKYVAEAVRRSDLSRVASAWFRGASIVLAVAVLIMSAGVIAWGWSAELYASSAFHARDGGLFDSMNVSSWALSVAFFLCSAVLAVKSRRAAMKLG
ncbi:MAG: hypothetical protein ACRENC_02900, partial [Gemmatimonadaceae bacterium]